MNQASLIHRFTSQPFISGTSRATLSPFKSRLTFSWIFPPPNSRAPNNLAFFSPLFDHPLVGVPSRRPHEKYRIIFRVEKSAVAGLNCIISGTARFRGEGEGEGRRLE